MRALAEEAGIWGGWKELYMLSGEEHWPALRSAQLLKEVMVG